MSIVCPPRAMPCFPYWREFERSPPVRVHTLSAIEYFPYGISEQATVRLTPRGAVHVMRLRQFSQRPITITTSKSDDGRCTADVRVVLLGTEAGLSYVYAKLSSGILPGVDYLDLYGRDLTTGRALVERVKR